MRRRARASLDGLDDDIRDHIDARNARQHRSRHDAGRGARGGRAAAVRQRRADQGRRARRCGSRSGSISCCRTRATAFVCCAAPGLHRGRDPDARARHRPEHRRVQRRQRGADPAAGVSASRAPGLDRDLRRSRAEERRHVAGLSARGATRRRRSISSPRFRSARNGSTAATRSCTARVATVTDEFWDSPARAPALGRLPSPDEDAIVLSHAFFERCIRRRCRRVGRPVDVNGRQVVVAGVLPPGFRVQLPPPRDASPAAAGRPRRLSCDGRPCAGAGRSRRPVVQRDRPPEARRHYRARRGRARGDPRDRARTDGRPGPPRLCASCRSRTSWSAARGCRS